MQEQDEKKRKKAEYNKMYAIKNRERILENERKYKDSGRRAELRIIDAPKRRKATAEWYAKNKELKADYMKLYKEKCWNENERKQRELLSDSYVIKVIKKASGYTLSRDEITQEQIEIKKNEILINRIIKQIKTKENELQNSRFKK
jgi:hypothetical protein